MYFSKGVTAAKSKMRRICDNASLENGNARRGARSRMRSESGFDVFALIWWLFRRVTVVLLRKSVMLHIKQPLILEEWRDFLWNHHRRTQDFTMEEVVHLVGGRARGSGGRKSPVGSRGKVPVGSLGDEVPRS